MENSLYIGFKTDESTPTGPLPKQAKALESFEKHKHTLMGGSFGWGKTDAMVIECIMQAIQYKGNMCLLGRKYIDSFNKSTLDSLLGILPPELILRHNKQEHEIELIPPYRSKIVYMQLDASRDAMQKINSMNLGFFGVDQLEEIEEGVFDALVGRLRRKNTARSSLSTCNPAGHNWLYKRFVASHNEDYNYIGGSIWPEGVPPPERQEDVTIERCDNPYLAWDYIRDLLVNMPERWVKRYIYGSWENFEAVVWPEASREMMKKRIVDGKVTYEGGHVVKPFDIPDWWNRYVVLDHGHRNPTAVLFIAVDGDDNWWLYDCHYQAGKWVDYHASVIHEKIRGQNITTYLADPSMFSERDSEATIGKQYQEYGLYFQHANRDVPGGIDKVARAFKERRIRVFDLPQFEPFWEEISNYRWDDMGRSDKERPVKKDDHLCDCLRMTANHLYAARKPVKPKHKRYFLKRFTKKSFMGL